MDYNKLVRDKMPSIIKKGRDCEIRHLNREELGLALCDKLIEEVGEFLSEPSQEELADILEVVFGLSKHMGINPTNLLKIAEEKCMERGGYDDRVFLISTAERNSCTHRLPCGWCCFYKTLCVGPQGPFDCQEYDRTISTADEYHRMYKHKRDPDESKWDNQANWK